MRFTFLMSSSPRFGDLSRLGISRLDGSVNIDEESPRRHPPLPIGTSHTRELALMLEQMSLVGTFADA